MRRHDSLIPLTHDHHHALSEVRRMKLASKKSSEQERVDAAQRFLGFFHDETIRHFRQEEDDVFPLVAESDELKHVVARVLAEHLSIQDQVKALTSEVAEGRAGAETLARLATDIESHVRFEEKVVFPEIERVAGHALGAINLIKSRKGDER